MSEKILVIGSTNVDFIVKSERLPSKGETVTGGTFRQVWGGKGANQAVAAARAGGNVTFVTNLGNDSFADQLTESFRKDGIDTSLVFRDETAATGSALIMIDSMGNNCISVAPGANFRLMPENIDTAVDAIKSADIIVLQMEIPFETISHIISLAHDYGKKVIFNLAPAMPFEKSVLRKTYAFVVNEVEASMVAGIDAESDEGVVLASR
nr:PfkB family carbohydrate kinase [Bacteroidales bacterium]